MSILDSKAAASLVLCMAVSSSWGADLKSEMARARALEAFANRGDPVAQTNLSRIYLFGPKEMRDEAKAVHWLRQAVQKNHGPAEYLFGMVLLSNKNDNAKMQEGGSYLTRSAAHGCAGAAGLLGNMFLAASSRNPDIEPKAVNYIRQAAEGGDYMSQTLLAKLYSSGGKTIGKDPVTAYAWLEFAHTDRPNHAFSGPSQQLRMQLKGNLDEAQLARANELAASFKAKYAKEKYEFCSQSLPDEMRNEAAGK